MTQVKDIQTKLQQLGFYNDKIDGDYGPLTKDAVSRFQTSRGLLADGKVGPMTTAALWPEVRAITPGLLSPEVIRAVAPKARQDIVDGLLARPDKFDAAGLVTKMRMAHFLAQTANESGGFSKLEESLNYSIEGLLSTFGRHRITHEQAASLGRKPGRPANQEEIANILYGGAYGRKNLGNTQPGDGWRFRGGGLIQTTGRANYKAAGHDSDPEFIRSMPGALDAALVFWQINGLNDIADRDDIEALSRKANGGMIGLPERKAYLAKAKKALGV